MATEMSYDANDPAQVAERQAEVDRRELETLSLVKDILGSPVGRAWMFDLINQTGFFTKSFVPGAGDATAYNEGSRSIGISLFMKCLKADPLVFPAMMRENQSKI